MRDVCEVREIRDALPGVWQRVVSTSDAATIFHTPLWADIVVAAYPEYRVATRAFLLPDGVTAIVPMVATVERNGFFGWYESIFPGGYGGPVAERPLSAYEAARIVLRLPTRRVAHLHVMGNPLSPIEPPPSFSSQPQFTHTLDLGAGIEATRARYHDSHKRSIKKATKAGVVVVAAAERGDFDSYYGLYVETLSRWADSTLIRFPRSVFDEVQKRRSPALRLWAARLDGKMIAGMLVFYHRRCAFYWHGASCPEAMTCGAGPLLMDGVLRAASEEGIALFDFGPSGSLKGVEEFKERFGAARREFGSFVWKDNPLYRLYSNALRIPALAARRMMKGRGQAGST